MHRSFHEYYNALINTEGEPLENSPEIVSARALQKRLNREIKWPSLILTAENRITFDKEIDKSQFVHSSVINQHTSIMKKLFLFSIAGRLNVF